MATETIFCRHFFNANQDLGKNEIGLAIARQIIEETHDEKLSFHLVIGEGKEFIIEIIR